MKQKATLMISIASLIISIASICLVSLRCEPMKADWLGILVGILAFCTTILIAIVGGGFYFNHEIINKKIRDLDNRYADIASDSLFYNHINDIQFFTYHKYGEYFSSLNACISALKHNCDEGKRRMFIEYINNITKSYHIEMNKKDIVIIIDALKRIKHIEGIEELNEQLNQISKKLS